jgi:hypothetical protein
MNQIRVFDLPCEIVFIILKYTDNNTLRKIKKIPALSLYKQEIDRLIQKELKNQIDYRNYYMNKFITDCFTKQHAKDELEFNKFGRMHWSPNQLHVNKTVKKYTNSAINTIKKKRFNLPVELILHRYKKNMVKYLYPLSFLDNPILSDYYTNRFLDDAYRDRIRLQLERKLNIETEELSY